MVTEVLGIVGGVAGVGGLGIGVLLLVYRDVVRELIRRRAFHTMSSEQAAILLSATIVFSFTIAVLGMFVGLASGEGAVPFIALVGLLLVFILGCLLIATRRGSAGRADGASVLPANKAVFFRVWNLIAADRPDDADRELAAAAPKYQKTAEYWYWRARVAFARGNVDVAAAYVDEALSRDARDQYCIALRIKLLLLSSREADRPRARELAARSRGVDQALDAWLTCLAAEGILTPGARSNIDIDGKCQFPEPTWS